ARRQKSRGAIALALLALVVLTGAYGIVARENVTPPSRHTAARSREAAAPGSIRCALYHARFGGRRAQLILITQGPVRNYVIIEVGRSDPASRILRSTWLRAAYGEAEHVWLGEYGSAEAAITSAARLCPASERCWADESGCGPKEDVLTPAQTFLRWSPTSPPGM
ncbi:MAG: hypothetical protein J2P51_14700, partial [Hyphomicrobiaceae bacterium]|nr:hypothetical protein [Hyphomicrobiaceae bacterium]